MQQRLHYVGHLCNAEYQLRPAHRCRKIHAALGAPPVALERKRVPGWQWAWKRGQKAPDALPV